MYEISADRMVIVVDAGNPLDVIDAAGLPSGEIAELGLQQPDSRGIDDGKGEGGQTSLL